MSGTTRGRFTDKPWIEYHSTSPTDTGLKVGPSAPVSLGYNQYRLKLETDQTPESSFSQAWPSVFNKGNPYIWIGGTEVGDPAGGQYRILGTNTTWFTVQRGVDPATGEIHTHTPTAGDLIHGPIMSAAALGFPGALPTVDPKGAVLPGYAGFPLVPSETWSTDVGITQLAGTVLSMESVSGGNNMAFNEIAIATGPTHSASATTGIRLWLAMWKTEPDDSLTLTQQEYVQIGSTANTVYKRTGISTTEASIPYPTRPQKGETILWAWGVATSGTVTGTHAYYGMDLTVDLPLWGTGYKTDALSNNLTTLTTVQNVPIPVSAWGNYFQGPLPSTPDYSTGFSSGERGDYGPAEFIVPWVRMVGQS